MHRIELIPGICLQHCNLSGLWVCEHVQHCHSACDYSYKQSIHSTPLYHLCWERMTYSSEIYQEDYTICPPFPILVIWHRCPSISFSPFLPSSHAYHSRKLDWAIFFPFKKAGLQLKGSIATSNAHFYSKCSGYSWKMPFILTVKQPHNKLPKTGEYVEGIHQYKHAHWQMDDCMPCLQVYHANLDWTFEDDSSRFSIFRDQYWMHELWVLSVVGTAAGKWKADFTIRGAMLNT